MSNSKECKFNVGDKVIRVDYEGGWSREIEVGQCYTILQKEGRYVNVLTSDEDGNGWLLDIRFELYEEKETEMALTSTMNAEQIRDEILRIDARIGEAKKDIENAEKERNSLVEKLREKGFEIASQHKVLPLLDSPFLEINAEYVINERNNSTWMEKGTKVICTDIDPSSRKLDAKVEDSEGNDDWVNSECLTKI